uniref:Uncharacterized protein n=1 Tax=Oryza brachyantha TaxID=4533 RepID=J3MF50_ORYBR
MVVALEENFIYMNLITRLLPPLQISYQDGNFHMIWCCITQRFYPKTRMLRFYTTNTHFMK